MRSMRPGTAGMAARVAAITGSGTPNVPQVAMAASALYTLKRSAKPVAMAASPHGVITRNVEDVSVN